jgi:hypothetical protein
LPLHVIRRITTSTLQGDDVVNNITRTAFRKAGLLHELFFDSYTADDSTGFIAGYLVGGRVAQKANQYG